MMALLRSSHASGDCTPHVPVGYPAHAAEVLQRYAPDKNLAIQCMVTFQTVCQMKLELRHLAILEPVVEISADLSRQCLSQIHASPTKATWLVS